MFYPIYLNLRNRRVVVVGGGEVAERKVQSLVETGAVIVVISPEVTPRIAALAQDDRVELHLRPYTSRDCKGAMLVISATDDAELSKKVFDDSHRAGALINTADQPGLCDFIMPAVVRRGDITIAISTGGTSPGLAARLREKVSAVIGPEYGRLAELLSRARPEIRRRIPDEGERKALQYRILDSDIIDRLKRNDVDGAERRLKELIGL
jgi:siroheme synthase-like protein